MERPDEQDFRMCNDRYGLGLSTGADAHSLRLQCKMITNEDVVCRAITTDGELARDVEIQLLATTDYRVLAKGKTDAAGMYAFKVPEVGYHVVATGDKAHVANLASVDIWQLRHGRPSVYDPGEKHVAPSFGVRAGALL